MNVRLLYDERSARTEPFEPDNVITCIGRTIVGMKVLLSNRGAVATKTVKT